jgi:hypothetical protein
MKKRALLLAMVLLCAASPALRAQHSMGIPMPADPAPKPSDLTLAQLLAKSAAARGGEQKLNAIQSVTMTGTWVTTQAKASPVTATFAQGGRFVRRIDSPDSSGNPSYKAANGTEAWEISPQIGIMKPTPMLPQDASRYRRLTDPQGALINPQGKKNKVELVGKTTWHDSDVYKLKVTYPDGSSNYIYLDAKSFLPVRIVDSLYVNQAKREFDLEILFEDYRDVNGVKWPFLEKIKAPEISFAQTTSWKTIEPNKQFDPAIFKGPKG